MNPIRGILVASVLVTSMVEVQACGPYFPVSYFPHVYNFADEFSKMPGVDDKARKDHCAYRVTPHLGTELAMIGAHYYPAWTGKAPAGNRVSTAQADELDFFAAGASAGVPKKTIAEDWRRFVVFRDGVCGRLEGGEKVDVPHNVPDYALEFYLYKLGHAQWIVFRRDEDPAPFGRLLALPKERRLYRTVWVHFVRIANARRFAEKDRHLDALRQALDAGFKDTAALASFTLRFLSSTCRERYDPLVLTAFAHVEWKEWPGFAKRIFCRRRPAKTPEREWVEALCVDQVGVEVAIAHGAGGCLPTRAVRPDHPALGADRQAWIAFNRGDPELCGKLLELAPARSLIRLFLEARLARLEGNYNKAAERLHEWLVEYRRRGTRADELVGYGIGVCGEDYWFTGHERDGGGMASGSIIHSGKYGPAGESYEWGVCDFRDHLVRKSHEPTLSRIVFGELGMVQVATRDLEEALYAFLSARNWIDAAFVAERCMMVDELMKFMHGGRIEPRDVNPLRGLLMRRLMRSGRIQEAAAWAPRDLKPLCDEFRALSDISRDQKASSDVRALALLNLSRLTAVRGMELMGTELRPDVAIYEGAYSTDAVPIAEPVELPQRLGMVSAATRWSGWKEPEDRVTRRFHYRLKSLAYARAAVEQAKNADVRAWALMFGGVVALSMDDAKEADWFYKRLAAMHHPRAKVEGWFTGVTYRWFKETYYDKERHLTSLRVPPRLTLNQLGKLKAPTP